MMSLCGGARAAGAFRLGAGVVRILARGPRRVHSLPSWWGMPTEPRPTAAAQESVPPDASVAGAAAPDAATAAAISVVSDVWTYTDTAPFGIMLRGLGMTAEDFVMGAKDVWEQTAPALFSDEGTAKLPAVMHDGILQAALGVRLPLKLKVAAAKVVGVKSCWDYTGLDETPSRAAVTAWVRRALEYPPAAWPPERFFRIDARDGHVVVLPERNSHLESALSFVGENPVAVVAAIFGYPVSLTVRVQFDMVCQETVEGAAPSEVPVHHAVVMEATQGVVLARDELYGDFLPRYFPFVMNQFPVKPAFVPAEDRGWRIVDIDNRFLLTHSKAVRWVHDSILADAAHKGGASAAK